MEFVIFLLSLFLGFAIFCGFVAILLATLWGLLLGLKVGAMWLLDKLR